MADILVNRCIFVAMYVCKYLGIFGDAYSEVLKYRSMDVHRYLHM